MSKQTAVITGTFEFKIGSALLKAYRTAGMNDTEIVGASMKSLNSLSPELKGRIHWLNPKLKESHER